MTQDYYEQPELIDLLGRVLDGNWEKLNGVIPGKHGKSPLIARTFRYEYDPATQTWGREPYDRSWMQTPL